MAKRHRVAVLPGDGIGPEVTREAVETLKLAAEIGGFGFEWTSYPFGAEHYLRTKETFPPGALEEMRGQDAILLGAIGDPRLPTGMLERAIISGIRFGLDLYVNLRPIRLFHADLCPLKGKGPEHVDLIALGTHGSSNVPGQATGGVARALLRQSPLPLLVARA